jgi:predicted RNA polymerase sigma factor
MAQRISRAKQTIKDSGVPFEAAGPLASVLHVLYLIFNEGYTDLRVDLSAEAIRLTRMVHALRPDPEATGLLALMLLTDARRPARTREGALVPLDEQDRSRWRRDMIDEGLALVADALPRGAVGPYQLQAAIAAVHDEAPSAEDTDWPQILALYTVLLRIDANPMVALNRAIALAMVEGPRAGLAALAELDADPRLAHHHRLAAVRAHLLERAGDVEAARAAYQAAAAATNSTQERDYLMTRAARLGYPART